MRGVLLALALLTVPLAGCFGLLGSDVVIERPELAPGTLLTYHVETGEVEGNQTFVVLPGPEGGYELHAYNLSESFNSPYRHLDTNLNPRVFNWSGILNWPLEDGKSNQATVGGAEATVELSGVDGVEGPSGLTDAIKAVATADGKQVAEIVVLKDPTVIQRIDVDTPDGTDETWVLQDVTVGERFNQPARWEIGDWWIYNATTQGETTQTHLVYNSNDTTQKGSLMYVLNPTRAEDRFPSLPFLRFRASDLAPQSGFLTGLVSSFWDWPLQDGKTWSGSTTLSGIESYQAQASLTPNVRLPDGSLTIGYTIELRPLKDPGAEPIGSYQYVPRVEMLTYAWIEDPESGERVIDWELEDWGDGFHGEMEIPRVAELSGRSRTAGPAEIDDPVNVTDRIERVQLKLTAVKRSDASPNVTFELVRPDGTTALRANETAFRDRLLQFNNAVDATTGTWRFQADVPEGVSFFGEVNGVWTETRQVDYR